MVVVGNTAAAIVPQLLLWSEVRQNLTQNTADDKSEEGGETTHVCKGRWFESSHPDHPFAILFLRKENGTLLPYSIDHHNKN